MSGGWDDSAQAWVAHLGEDGDYGRKHVLDAAILARIEGRGFTAALDVGCGEGRFCRMLAALGMRTVGIDPTQALLDRAKALDPGGEYRLLPAEAFLDESAFDLAVCYLSLIDIPDLASAIANIVASLQPGGTLLVANLTSFNTAGMPEGWQRGPDGIERFCIDRYFEERAVWVQWNGIRIQNWHRPLEAYMSMLLAHGMLLRYFAEPAPVGGDPARAERYRRVPWFCIMEWQKPGP